ncbi:MAG: BBP7 family outer membrane beta-barrel protein, partial [Gemmataceae bacterium]
KVALGQSITVGRTSGQSNSTVAGTSWPLIQPANTGFLVTPETAGRVKQSTLAFLPEGQIRIGCKLGDNGSFYVGYSFLYLSEAIRPGDLIPSTQTAGTNAMQTRMGPFGPTTMDRVAPLKLTDYWVQGLVFGLEGRY